MRAAKIPGALRDYCAHLLIPMNACRREHGFLPWTCSTEKHEYERCTYIEWLKAKAKKDERLGR